MTTTQTVYVVDADRSARRGLIRLLIANSLEVRGFPGIGEFLEALGPDTSGCLILDASEPEMLEADLSAKLADRDLSFPIIMITTDNGSDAKRQARRLNAVAFFRKPVDGQALLDAVRWALR